MKKPRVLQVVIMMVCDLLVVAGGLFALDIITVPKLNIDIYVYDPCGGCFVDTGPCKPCTLVEHYSSTYADLLSKNGLNGKVGFNMYNTLFKFYKQQYLEKLRAYNINQNEVTFPIAFVGDVCIQDEKDIENSLISTINSENSLISRIGRLFNIQPVTSHGKNVAAKTANAIIYFSIPGCEDCAKVKKLFDRLDSAYFKNGIQLIAYSIDDKNILSLSMKYRELYGVQGDDVIVPAIFTGTSYLEGYDEISKKLEGLLSSGDTAKTKIIQVENTNNRMYSPKSRLLLFFILAVGIIMILQTIIFQYIINSIINRNSSAYFQEVVTQAGKCLDLQFQQCEELTGRIDTNQVIKNLIKDVENKQTAFSLL